MRRKTVRTAPIELGALDEESGVVTSSQEKADRAYNKRMRQTVRRAAADAARRGCRKT